eukprot:1106244-Prymnesium_polylepis.1
MGLKLKERYGDWALVTGGHSGIGYCISEQLAAEGVNVIIAARGKAALEEAKAKITAKYQVEVRIVVADISSSAGLYGLIEAIKDVELGILVNNAGVEVAGFLAEQSPEKLEYALPPRRLTHFARHPCAQSLRPSPRRTRRAH